MEIHPPGLTEVSSMCFYPMATIGGANNGVLFVSSDREDTIIAYTPEGKHLGWEKKVPKVTSPGQEGVYADGCTFYITSDQNAKNQKVWRFRFETPGRCDDGEQNQDELCADVGGVCGGFAPGKETDCNDGKDNDCDGFVDGNDQDFQA
eukprot:comp18125_c1_seq1/m.18826 comp18125_c1_seq1/g.18826  ORF comp18125_c1_seq1/g.18826 comp18125_c1_seq1/m.18826 type:complete len:149 (-) comp18125_c1_seq1:17-463(-)